MERIPRLRQPMGHQTRPLCPTTHQRLPPTTSASPSTLQSIKEPTTPHPRAAMAHNKHNTHPYKKRGLVPRFHLPTRIMTSSRLDPSSLLHPHSPAPSPPLTPVPKPKEDRILFLPRPPYTIINDPHFHHDVSKSITSYMVCYLDVTRRLAHGPNYPLVIIPSFISRSFTSKTRQTYREKQRF